MVSEEYIETINKLMEIQNNQTNLWLAWIGIFLGGIALMQWWYNSKEVKNIEQRTRDRIFKEISEKLEVDDLVEIRYKLKEDNKKKNEEINFLKKLVETVYNIKDMTNHYGTATFEAFC